jgi:serine/threonine protein kinase
LVRGATEIDIAELTLEKEIGSGSFGVVFKGRWRQWAVAVKQLKSNVSPDSSAYEEFLHEAALMSALPPHPNVVR